MILVWDCETDGIPKWDLPADHESQPHIVEIGAVLCDEGGKEVDRFEAIVKPDGYEIPDVVAKIHGITTAIALEKGRPIADVMDEFEALTAKATLIVCFNVRFDEKFRRSALRRLGRPDGFGTIPVFCCMRGATPLCKLERTVKQKKAGFDKGQYKTPKLSEAVQMLLGREHVGAHGALADALATKDIYFACRDNHEFMAAGSAFKTNEAKATVPMEPPAVTPVADAGPDPGPKTALPQCGSSTMDDLFKLY